MIRRQSRSNSPPHAGGAPPSPQVAPADAAAAASPSPARRGFFHGLFSKKNKQPQPQQQQPPPPPPAPGIQPRAASPPSPVTSDASSGDDSVEMEEEYFHPAVQQPPRKSSSPAPRARFRGSGGVRDMPPRAPPMAPQVGGGAAGIVGDFWRCPQCTVANETILSHCLVCNGKRPAPEQGGPNLGSFVCAVCTFDNADANAVQCEMCGTKRPTADEDGETGAGAGGPKGSGDPESKEDEEARQGGAFVLGQGSPPPLKRKPLVREHMAFLAGVEEAFGSMHVAPVLLAGIERLVKKPFEALQQQYTPAHPLSPSAVANSPITPEILDTLLKALTYRAAQRAIRMQGLIELIISCCVSEEDELRGLTCNACGQSGTEVALHYSDACGQGLRHTFCLRCTHEYVMGLVEKKQCGKILCPYTTALPSAIVPAVAASVDATTEEEEEAKEEPAALMMMPGGIVPADSASSSSSTAADPMTTAAAAPVLRCDKEVDVKWIRRCLSLREFQVYLDECFALMVSGAAAGGPATAGAPGSLGQQPSGGGGSGGSYITCPNSACKSIMEVVRPHGLEVPLLIKEVDEQGKQLTPAAWLHFMEFRVRCHACNANFCSACRVQPYHIGRSCEEHQGYLVARHCRFCADSLTPENTDASNQIKAFENICTAELCRERREAACTEMLPCGHPCPGVRGEADHVPCLLDDCAQRDPNLKAAASDLCSICWVEELGLAPVVQLSSCGHIFHHHCVRDKLSKKWPGVRITFGFMDCSVCKVPMDHPSPGIQALKRPIDDLYTSIKSKALARLSIEKMDKDAKLVDPSSRYYNQPLKYAIDCFAYYNCHKCKKFYFGGRRDCEQNAAAENRPEEEFVCFDCADLKSVACKNKEHSEYQVWKCRFCCNVAVWFCFGTTHYCDPCHRDNPMEKVRRARSGFKQCPGYQMCPLKTVHSPNGSEAECEFCLGCGACQEELTKLQAAREKEKAVEAKVKEISHSSVQL